MKKHPFPWEKKEKKKTAWRALQEFLHYITSACHFCLEKQTRGPSCEFHAACLQLGGHRKRDLQMGRFMGFKAGRDRRLGQPGFPNAPEPSEFTHFYHKEPSTSVWLSPASRAAQSTASLGSSFPKQSPSEL